MSQWKKIFSIPNIIRNLIISIIAIFITLYFYYSPSFNTASIEDKRSERLFMQDKGKDSESNRLDGDRDVSNKDYELFYLEGLRKYSEGDLQRAVELLEQAAKIKETDEVNKSLQKIYNLLALQNLNEGKYKEAHNFYDKAIEISPTKALILEKANAYSMMGELDSALNFLKEYEKSFGNDADYLALLAGILDEMGKPAEAYEYLDKDNDFLNLSASAQIIKRRIENRYSINEYNVERGKTVLQLSTDLTYSKLFEKYLYSMAGEIASILSSAYGINADKQLNLKLSSSNEYSLPPKLGFDVSNMDTIYLQTEMLEDREFQRKIKYFLTKKMLSSLVKNNSQNLLFEGIALKTAQYSFWANEDRDYINNIPESYFSEVLESNEFPSEKGESAIYRILSDVFVDFILLDTSGKGLIDIMAKLKEGVSLKTALIEVTGIPENSAVSKWINYYKEKTGQV